MVIGPQRSCWFTGLMFVNAEQMVPDGLSLIKYGLMVTLGNLILGPAGAQK